MDFWRDVRREVLTGALSQRAAMVKYGLGWHTLKKILAHTEPPGYRQQRRRKKRKLEPFLPIIHQILENDRQAPRKQRHTAHRIFQRLRDVLPLSHPPGEAQVDFGEATVRLAGEETKVALFVLTLPYSGAMTRTGGFPMCPHQVHRRVRRSRGASNCSTSWRMPTLRASTTSKRYGTARQIFRSRRCLSACIPARPSIHHQLANRRTCYGFRR
jgi:hypothetical protein